MKALARWLKFNAVGAMGMVVQLGSLVVLTRMLPGYPLAASAMAVELAVLHNFAWHVRYTWRDRQGAWAPQLVRFQMANGLVSVLGNVVLMRALVGHMPLLAANGIAIAACSVVNFGLSNGWAFASSDPLIAKNKGAMNGAQTLYSVHAEPPGKVNLSSDSGKISML